MEEKKDITVPKESFTQKHQELWKFIKFSIAGFSATIIEIILHYVLQEAIFKNMTGTPPAIFKFLGNDNIGVMWSFIISTTVGYAIAFILNRKKTFGADSNPMVSIILYIIMVIFTIYATAALGLFFNKIFLAQGWNFAAKYLTKPMVAMLATAWTYPLNRFVIHRKKKETVVAEEENK